MNKTIPNMFFIDGQLHNKIEVIISDDTVVAYNYQEEKVVHLSRTRTRKYFKKAYTLSHAAKMMRVPVGRIKSIYDKGLMKNKPEFSYHTEPSRMYQKIRTYISEEDMLDLRQIAWDLLPKNRFGIPHNDVMTSEKELKHIMDLNDPREYLYTKDGVIKIFKEIDEF